MKQVSIYMYNQALTNKEFWDGLHLKIETYTNNLGNILKKKWHDQNFLIKNISDLTANSSVEWEKEWVTFKIVLELWKGNVEGLNL